MFRKLFILIALFLALGFIPADITYATTIEKSSQTWRCLKGTDSSYNLTWHDPPSPSTLTQQLSGDGFIDGRNIYVVACLPDNNTQCSTGEPANDQLLFGKDNSTLTDKNVYGEVITYKVIQVQDGSKKTSKGGKITATAVVGGANANATGGYTFYGVMITPPANEPLLQGMGAEQQGTFNFTAAQNKSKCVKISWTHYDPFGIVFDSKSLEPLPSVSVTVLDSKKKKVSLVGFPNPQVTKADGLFNFLVEPGEYYLELAPVPVGYQFKDNPSLHQNYVKIYHRADGGNSIYRPNELIREVIDTPEEQIKGMPDPERRDIPLDPGNNTPFTTAPVILNYGVTRIEDETRIEGKASHPFTTVTILQANQIIATQEADREGFFEILIENHRIRQDLALTLKLSKKDLLGDLSYIQSRLLLRPAEFSDVDIFDYFTAHVIPNLSLNVYAENIQLGRFKIIQPIFRMLKGYAYDKAGKIVPNAEVGVKLAMTDSLYYKTKADNTGYFDIEQDHLPIFNYNITVSSPFSPTPSVQTTSEFAKANKAYLVANKINLLGASTKTQGAKKSTSVHVQSATQSPKFSATRNSFSEAETAGANSVPPIQNIANEKKQMTKASKNTSAMLVFVSFLLLSLALLIIGIYFIKRKRSLQQQ